MDIYLLIQHSQHDRCLSAAAPTSLPCEASDANENGYLLLLPKVWPTVVISYPTIAYEGKERVDDISHKFGILEGSVPPVGY